MSDIFLDVKPVTVTKTKPKLPSMYKVIFHNDDFTPMDFVLKVLMANFDKNFDEARNLTMRVHEKGSGIAGIYTREIAETKQKETMDEARANGFPLRLSIEQD